MSTAFEERQLSMPEGETERVVIGGRDEATEEMVRRVLESAGISSITALGWGVQAEAQMQNLRDTVGTDDFEFTVGLRDGSTSREEVERLGFNTTSLREAAGKSGLVLCLISDAAQVQRHDEILGELKPGSTFGLSHGFLEGYLQTVGTSLSRERDDINHVMIAPKAMGPSVRRLYEQGSGANVSMAIEHDATGDAGSIAEAWGVGIGAPNIFETTLDDERKSDIFGERAILLGGVQGIVQAVFEYHANNGMSRENAFKHSVETLTGPISTAISDGGLREVFNRLPETDRETFIKTYNAAFPQMRTLMDEIYMDVASNREIGSVIDGTKRVEKNGWTNAGNMPMWQETGKKVRDERNPEKPFEKIDPVTAGLYIAGMVAQAEVLRSNGHKWSEIANETIIEAVDSLNPYMHAKGIDAMVDGCSVTARLGGRKWSPRFEDAIKQAVFPVLRGKIHGTQQDHFRYFEAHPVHEAFAKCAELRPEARIAVV